MTDLEKTEALRPGDDCEFRYPARRTWLPGRVVLNGSSGYWHVRDESWSEGRFGKVNKALYIEHVRAPGTDPWS